MNSTTNNTAPGLPDISAEALAHLGDGEIAYVRTIRSEDVPAMFPQAPEIAPGLKLYALHAADGYPPYNIERIARENGRPERLRITLAVAGFTRDELDITVEENQLAIRGRQRDEQTRQFLHRGDRKSVV